MPTEHMQFRELFVNSKIGFREIESARGPVLHIVLHIVPGSDPVESSDENPYFALRFNRTGHLLDVVLKKVA
jgi:hypothetical protein